MEHGRFVDWLYESSEQPRDSVIVARAIFFAHISEQRCPAALSLATDVWPDFLDLAEVTFQKKGAIQNKIKAVSAREIASRNPAWVGMLSVMGNIPKDEIKAAFKDLATVSKSKHAKVFCAKLQAWCRAQNLDVEWC
ncbi:MAG: hypothetical protein ACR2HX_09945 [Pyrinomonadaceae bacterium]